jgi:PAS domain S-box-containing protein
MQTFETIGIEVLNSVIQSINAAVILHDCHLKVILINDTFEEIFEIKKEDALGKSPLEFLPEFDREHKKAILERLQKTLLTKVRSPAHEFTYYAPSGKLNYFSAISIPIIDRAGKISHVMSIVSDLTPQKKLEKQVVETARLSSLGDMVYTLAHEINNPLTGIKLGLSTLYGSLQKDENIQILDSVMKDLNRIQQTVSTFLQTRKAQYRLIKKKSALVGEILEDVLFHLDGQLDLQHITVKKTLSPEEGELLIDRDRIYQLLLNLLLNAIHSLPNGGAITLTTRIRPPRESHPGEGPFFCLSLSDTGTGIPPQQLQEIFRPFYSLRLGGAGLGLTICQDIVAAHQGLIQVDSELGRGTSFHIFLPLISEGRPS